VPGANGIVVNNKLLSSRHIFQGKIINLRLDEVELPDGRHTTREVIEHPGACVIVPIDKEGMVHLVRQYRDAAAELLLELPAGKIKTNEEPLDCARRECLEELGLTAGSWRYLASFYSSPGFCNEVLHCFLARDLSREEKDTDREEFLETVVRPLEPVEKLIEEIKDAKSLAGIMLARQILSQEQ
jgi:ADP-ribose pyrophosphatase